MFKSFFKSKHPKVPPNTNKLTFNHISFITSIDEFGNIKIVSFDCPLIKINENNAITKPPFWSSPEFGNSLKKFGSSKFNANEFNLFYTLLWRLNSATYKNHFMQLCEEWLFEYTERFNQRKQILELLLNKTIDYINQKKSFYEEITKHPDIELKLSDQEYEKLRKELFG